MYFQITADMCEMTFSLANTNFLLENGTKVDAEKMLFKDIKNYIENEQSCEYIMKDFILNFLCEIGWNYTILEYDEFEEVFKVNKIEIIQKFSEFCNRNGLPEMNVSIFKKIYIIKNKCLYLFQLLYILFMTNFEFFESEESTKLIFCISLFSQKIKLFVPKIIENAYNNLSTLSSYSVDLTTKILKCIIENQIKSTSFKDFYDLLKKSLEFEIVSKTIVKNHIQSSFFFSLSNDVLKVFAKSFAEVLLFPRFRNLYADSKYTDANNNNNLMSKFEYFKSNKDKFAETNILKILSKKSMDSKVFLVSNLGCYICHINFEDALSLQNHINYHKTLSSDFELSENGYFTISHEENKENVLFKLRNGSQNILIEKIIFITTKFDYINVHKMPMPMKANEIYEFTRNISGNKKEEIQLVFIIYKNQSNLNKTIIEEYIYYVSIFCLDS